MTRDSGFCSLISFKIGADYLKSRFYSVFLASKDGWEIVLWVINKFLWWGLFLLKNLPETVFDIVLSTLNSKLGRAWFWVFSTSNYWLFYVTCLNLRCDSIDLSVDSFCNKALTKFEDFGFSPSTFIMY